MIELAAAGRPDEAGAIVAFGGGPAGVSPADSVDFGDLLSLQQPENTTDDARNDSATWCNGFDAR